MKPWAKKLKKKYGGKVSKPDSEPSVSVQQTPPATSRQALPFRPHRFELEPHGLFVLHPTPELRVASKTLDVDIVAVHGLNGTARKTWTDKDTGKFWLEDFLPDAVPNSRIMTFGYDSGLAFSRSTSGIENYARDLLNRLRIVRSSYEARDRPLVFIAHSLGGIVVKKALILAHEAEDYYGGILQSTTGIIFLGTPHRGSDLIPWMLLLSNLINIASFGQAIKKTLLRNIDKDSEMLSELSRQFVHRSSRLKIMSFIEEQIDRPLTTLVVPEHSAVLGLPNEIILPLNAHHRSMCRYASKEDPNYIVVEAAIKEIVSGESAKPVTEKPTSILANAARDVVSIVPSPRTAKRARISPRNIKLGGELSVDSAKIAGGGSLSTLENALDSTLTSTATGSPQLVCRAQSPSLGLLPRHRHSQLSPALLQLNQEAMNIRVNGLRRAVSPETYGCGVFSHMLHLPSHTDISSLGAALLKEYPDLKYGKPIKFKAFGHEIQQEWRDIFTTEVQVTAERPCYDKSKGLKISATQSIASFFSKAFPGPIEARLDGNTVFENSTPFSKLSSPKVAVGRGRDTDLLISFMRTLRIPEDQSTYDLPPDLGAFPIFDIQPFCRKLPPAMAAQGGLFLPMYQMEAMWIDFECFNDRKFIIRPYLGGVNGVSGEPLIANMGSLMRRMNTVKPKQDYIVLPEQVWLDGIATSPGLVKQFVATEMAPPGETRQKLNQKKQRPKKAGKQPSDDEDEVQPPAGASIEWQVTGQETVGGIQLQIIPSFDLDAIFAGSVKDVCKVQSKSKELASYIEPTPSKVRLYKALSTPEEEGLKPGDIIHIKDMRNQQGTRPKVIADIPSEAPVSLDPHDVIELELHYDQATECIFHIRLSDGSGPPVSLKFAVDEGFDDIAAVVQHKLQGRPGKISVRCPMKNADDTLIPVHSWSKLLQARRRLKGISDSESKPLDEDALEEWDVTWMPLSTETSPFICRIDYNIHCKPVFGDGQPFLLDLACESTILDLRTEIERVTGLSTANYAIRSSISGRSESDTAKAFNGYTEADDAPIFKFSLRYTTDDGRPEWARVLIKMITGKTITIDCELSDMVADLKEKILELKNIPLEEQILIFEGKELFDDTDLVSSGIRNNSMLDLCGGQDPRTKTKSKPFRAACHPTYTGGDCLYIQTLTGRVLILPYDMLNTVHTVMIQIEEAEGIPPVQQQLSYDGRLMETMRTLESYAISPGATVTLILVLRGAGSGIVILYDGGKEKIYPLKEETVGDLKLELWKRLGIPARSQILLYEGRALPDSARAHPYRGRTLKLLIGSAEDRVVSLGIGAGGTIIQNIEPDTNDPRIWDVASAKILSVQIIDSRTFKLVTGLPPPPTPITAQTYAEMGLPFFQIWRDEQRAAGVAGQWQNIMGPAEVANMKLKQTQKTSLPDAADAAAAAVETLTGGWGLLKSGAWGKSVDEEEDDHEADDEENYGTVAAEKENLTGGKSGNAFKERGGFDFPIVLLDVDDTVPVFKSILQLSDGEDDYDIPGA